MRCSRQVESQQTDQGSSPRGALSQDVLMDRVALLFQEADTDGNGTLSRAEFQQVINNVDYFFGERKHAIYTIGLFKAVVYFTDAHSTCASLCVCMFCINMMLCRFAAANAKKKTCNMSHLLHTLRSTHFFVHRSSHKFQIICLLCLSVSGND